MEWSLKTGRYREWIEQLIADGHDLTNKGYGEIPTLDTHLHLAWDAFQRLTTSRNNGGMSMGYIAVSEIKAYYNLLGINCIPKSRIDQIQILDYEAVKFYNNKADKDEKPRR